MTELTRAQLLDTLQHGWATYVGGFQSLSSEAQAEFLVKQGYVHFADLLAHIVAWWEEGKRVIEKLADDPDFAPPEYDVDLFNAQAVERFGSWREAAIIEAFEHMQATWLDLVARLPDDAFHNQNLAHRLRLELVAHLGEHQLPSLQSRPPGEIRS